MKKEIYIHLGLPKTATTTLQNRVFLDQQKGYLYLGKYYADYHPENEGKNSWINQLKSDLIMKDSPFFDAYDFETVLRENFRIADNPQKYLLSEEAFFSRCLNPDKYGKLITIGSPRHVLNNLCHLFRNQPEYKVRLIFVLRSQPDLVESFFAQSFFRYKNYLGLTTPDEFTNYIFSCGNYSPVDSLLRYSTLINYMEQLFGSENILALPYEKMKSDPEIFLNEMTDYMGIDPWDFQVLTKKKDNFGDTRTGKLATTPPLSHRLVKLKNSLFGNVSFGVQKYLKFLDTFTPKKSVAMSDSVRKQLFDRYLASNEALRDKVKYIEEFHYF